MDLATLFPFSVASTQDGLRLDQVLPMLHPEVSRSRWASLADEGHFASHGKVLSPSDRLKAGQVIECRSAHVVLTKHSQPRWDSLRYKGPEIPVLFEDEHCVVVNKPTGVVVHAGAGDPAEESLVAWAVESGRLKSQDLIHFDSAVLEEARPGVVHRLDKGSSGALILAKNPQAHQALSEQFADRSAGRYYWAIIGGELHTLKTERPYALKKLLLMNPAPVALKFSEDGRVSLASFLERDPSSRTRFRVSDGAGKRAVTHLWQLSHSEMATLVECKLDTGRTHQIRVHLSFLGYPILGDAVYGGAMSYRCWLHAHTLEFRHPASHKIVRVQAPLSAADEQFVSALGLKLSTQL
jgi:23S rRNA pseudouridine1911/1915/1917 synthase